MVMPSSLDRGARCRELVMRLCLLLPWATLALLSGCAARAPVETADTGLTLVWRDEFDGPAGARVDSTRWRHDIGDGCGVGICGWGNNEKEWYTSDPANVALDGEGNLRIVARPAQSLTCYYGPCRYTSGKITTRGLLDVGPGRVEARIRLPAGQGLWPAFWMLGRDCASVGWPQCGELDIMEYRGSDPRTTSSAIHGSGYSGQTPFAHALTLATGSATFAEAFHRFAIEWDSARVRYYVDDSLHYAVTRQELTRYGPSVLGNRFFLILNLAVGGHFDGDPASDAILPATMLVDYVRVWSPARGR